MKKIFYSLIILSAMLLSACHHEKVTPVVTSPDQPGSTLDKIKDSVFLYAKEDYLWYNSLPSYAAFQPRSYSDPDDKTALTKELNKISQIAINPNTNQPYEYYAPDPGQAKYSFIDDGAVAAELNGNRGDFGFGLQYYDVDDIRVTYVYPGSPADQAGLKRGYRITSINNRTALSFDTNGYGDNSGNNYNFVVNAYENSNTISLVVTKPDGSSYTPPTISIANYTVNPVLTYKTFDEGNGHIVGYVVFNSFTSEDNALPQLNTAFSYFQSQNVTDLVVDLRYNGGGYVLTAEDLDNMIAPASKTGTLMYNTYYNDILTNGKEVLLKKQWRKDPTTGQDYNYGQFDYSVAGNAVNFAKQGGLNVGRVFFIITGSTASASELTINNLRPQMDVQFVGETSYGKPVGFFDIDINKYQMYIPEFSVKNSAGQGDYYGGFTPGDPGFPGIKDIDDMTKDFGDPTEGLLAHILNYVKNGSYTASVQGQTVQSLQSKRTSFALTTRQQIARKLNNKGFNMMIMNKKLKLRKQM
ncbi:MAG: S41 family peptidase [Mucilaginibacter sp.]